MISPRFRPIDQELKNLHAPLVVTLSDDDGDIDMALSGFRVKTSDSIIMMNHLTHPLLMRPKNSDTQTIGTGSIPKSGDGPTDPTLSDQNPQPYAEYHRGGYPHHRHAISQLLPTQQRRIHHDMKCTLRHYYDQKYHRTFPCSL